MVGEPRPVVVGRVFEELLDLGDRHLAAVEEHVVSDDIVLVEHRGDAVSLAVVGSTS